MSEVPLLFYFYFLFHFRRGELHTHPYLLVSLDTAEIFHESTVKLPPLLFHQWPFQTGTCGTQALHCHWLVGWLSGE